MTDFLGILLNTRFQICYTPFMSTKEKVLEFLQQNLKNPVSGEKLAEICKVSRTAIWKAMNSLREEGYQIEGTTNGGYILQEMADIFSKDNFLGFLRADWINTEKNQIEKSTRSDIFTPAPANSPAPAPDPPANRSTTHANIPAPYDFPDFPDFPVIECFKTIDSTNSYAKRLLSECGNLRNPDGTLTQAGKKYHKSIFLAESQTAGRGRLGRTFVSPEKTGIYLSLIYAPEGGITEPAKLTAFSAVALVRVIKRLYKIDAKIKWVNDIFIGGKKICGILTEGSANFETGLIEAAVVGIGVNISDNPEVFAANKGAGSIIGAGIFPSVAGNCPPENENCPPGNGDYPSGNENYPLENGDCPLSTNLSAQKPAKVTRCQLAAEIVNEVLKLFQENPAKVMAEYKSYSFLIGKTVEVHPIIGDDKSAYQAKVLDIDDNAGLVVQLADNSLKTLSSGEVSLHSDSIF